MSHDFTLPYLSLTFPLAVLGRCSPQLGSFWPQCLRPLVPWSVLVRAQPRRIPSSSGALCRVCEGQCREGTQAGFAPSGPLSVEEFPVIVSARDGNGSRDVWK